MATRALFSMKGAFRKPAPLLRELGIDHRPGNNFWVINAGRLEYIFYDFQQRARELKRELHPDTPGGDEDKFQAFNNHCAAMEAAFQRRGIGPQLTAASRQEQIDHKEARKKAQKKVLPISDYAKRDRREYQRSYYRKHRARFLKYFAGYRLRRRAEKLAVAA